MAATIFGFGTGEIKPQPGLSISRSESGGWTATHEVVIKSADLADALPSFASGTLLSDIDPDVPAPFDEFLKIDTVTIARTDGDLVTLSVNATGGTAQYENDELQPDAIPTYTLTGQLQDVHFSMHPKWKALGATDKKLLGLILIDICQFDPATNKIIIISQDNTSFIENPEQFTSEDAISFATLIAQGQTTYQKSSYTWNEATEGEDQLTPAQINKLGHISTPRGDPPEPAGTRNWMLTSVSQSQSGELYRTTLEWMLSEEGGFNDFLYED
jgi:hypothetical protein